MSIIAVSQRTLTPEMIEAAQIFGAANGISGALSANDYIFWYIYDNLPEDNRLKAATEYLQSGKGVSDFIGILLTEPRIREVLAQRDNATDPLSFLDFASGYGRVTRHLPGAVPGAEIFACDIHAEAVAFIESMGFKAIQSAHTPDKFNLGRSFDVIFALSFFTHMPRRTWKLWLDALGKHLNPNGLLIFTAHGEVSQIEMGVPNLEPDGFFFHTISEQQDLDTSEYGNTVTSFEYVYSQIRSNGLKLLQFKQAGAGHHDLYVLHKNPNGVRYLDALETKSSNFRELADNAAGLQREIDNIYQSTSWRVTGPLRHLKKFIKK